MTTTTRLRYLLRPREVTDQTNLQLLSVYRDYGVIPKDSRSDNFNKTPEDITRYQEVRVGDLVVNKMKAWQGSVGISAHHGIVSPDYLVCSVDPSVDSRFMHHLLRSAPLAAEFGARSKGIRPAQWRLYWEDLAEIPINLPVLDEQRRIADFLNAETTRIDRLASLRSRQLAQLDMRERAWRAHLLEQSKSGVRMRVKHLLCVKPRYGVLVPEFVDEGVPFIRVNSISGLSSLDGLPKIPKALSKQYARTVTGLGDILLSVVGSMGKATIVTEPLIGANVARAVAVLRLNLIHIPSLFTAWIGTAEFEQQAQLATGADSAQPTLGMEDLANFSLRWPTDGFEEKDMAMAVEEHQLDMEATRITLNRQLSLLAERRQALITAAVTGGITI